MNYKTWVKIGFLAACAFWHPLLSLFNIIYYVVHLRAFYDMMPPENTAQAVVIERFVGSAATNVSTLTKISYGLGILVEGKRLCAWLAGAESRKKDPTATSGLGVSMQPLVFSYLAILITGGADWLLPL